MGVVLLYVMLLFPLWIMYVVWYCHQCLDQMVFRLQSLLSGSKTCQFCIFLPIWIMVSWDSKELKLVVVPYELIALPLKWYVNLGSCLSVNVPDNEEQNSSLTKCFSKWTCPCWWKHKVGYCSLSICSSELLLML